MKTIDRPGLQSLLDDWRRANDVVGAVLGISVDGKVDAVASGVLNQTTKVEATPDSVFQIGSISKLFTATLAMQLVDEGRLDVDRPVKAYLPDFATADAKAAEQMTMRQFLNHTSGLEGDFFPADDLEGPSTASLVRKMRLLPQLFAPGQGPMTYSNSGYAVAGRVIEVLTGLPWQVAVMQRICNPLQMPQAFAHPHESLRFRCALGHVHDLPAFVADPSMKDPPVIPASITFLPMSMAAGGAVLSMSVDSLLRFVQSFMSDGAISEGRRMLSAAATQRMRNERVAIPEFSMPGLKQWGIGWIVSALADGTEVFGHDGATFGHYTYMKCVPDRNVAFALFTNSPNSDQRLALQSDLLKRLAGSELAPSRGPETFPVDAKRYVGTYRHLAAELAIEAVEGGLRGTMRDLAFGAPDRSFTLEPYRPDVFVPKGRLPGLPLYVSFLEPGAGGACKYVRFGVRTAKRVG